MKCSFEPGNNVQNEDRIRFVVADKVTRRNEQQRLLPNKKWIKSLWKYLDETDVVIPEFGKWCLFPSLWYDREPTLFIRFHS
jgi:hypothetical protein